MDIPERAQALGTKKQPDEMRPPQGVKVLPFEFRSQVVATWRFGLNAIPAHVLSLAAARNGIVQLVRRLAAGRSYSSFIDFRRNRIGTIA
jgi:hypothetical protein